MHEYSMHAQKSYEISHSLNSMNTEHRTAFNTSTAHQLRNRTENIIEAKVAQE